jgi:hypothetical protein
MDFTYVSFLFKLCVNVNAEGVAVEAVEAVEAVAVAGWG